MSGWHTDVNQMRTVKIETVIDEAFKVKTFFFKDSLCSSAEPGQFLMVWIPGVDEIPLSVSSVSRTVASVTVKEVGEATKALNRMKKGDIIGVRGPYGSHFKVFGENVLVVGGGTGMAPLMMLVSRLLDKNVRVTIIEGAKTRDELIFFNQLCRLEKEEHAKVIFTTDDGSYGVKGFATEAAEKVLSAERFDMVYVCGNEVMTRKIYDMSVRHKVPLQASLERIMLCGMGICGSCVIGKYRVCKDGPVFNQDQLKEVENELGRIKRNFTGEPVPI